jgi:catechol 2,3-dioxygenase-like lactoylglutathione lyase family enzyme
MADMMEVRMELLDIQHVAIRTDDLEATNDFYTGVLGMTIADRPNFAFPGSWLQMGETMIHVLAGKAGMDDDGGFTPGSSAVDHLALGAKGFDGFKKNIIDREMPWRENDIPEFGLWQLFIKDPNGITIELNFSTAAEPQDAAGPETATKEVIRL